MIDLLCELTAIPGLAGHEDAIGRTLAARLAPFAAEVRRDAVGNVIARVGVGPRRLAVLAHMDTVGLMVKRINPDGTLGVLPLGGANLKALPGTRVQVEGRDGLIGVRSHHLAQEGDALVRSADELYVDVGDDHDVEITAPVTYTPQCFTLPGGRVCSPHLDNRAGCAVLVELARVLQPLEGTSVYLIGTVQEETTCDGAAAALHGIVPEAAFFVDGTVSHDTPDTRGGSVALGAGPVLTAFLYTRGQNGWHAHPKLRAHCKQVARTAGIPFQQDAAHGLISDARVVAWLGIPSVVVGLPMRGKHAPIETAHLDDLTAAARLLQLVLSQPLPDLTWSL